MVGSFGDAEVFSFHATKFINTFEGGAITTNRDDLAAKIRLLINFGFAGYDRVVSLGTNGKMHEISAAMGLNSLDAADSFVRVNRENHGSYEAELSALPGLAMVKYSTRNRHNYQYVVIEVDADRQPSLARSLAVRRIPSLVVVKDRRVVGRLEGRVTGRQIDDLIRPHLG